MKTIRNYKKKIVLLLAMTFFMECVKDNEFEVPTTNREENVALNEILDSISNGNAELKQLLK